MRKVSQKPIKCEWGVVKKVWLSEKKVVLVHSPAWYETARKVEELMAEQGYNVVRLNTGNELDAELADELLDDCPE